ncbi:glycosyl transferase family protein [Lacibacterium aquatile]|uniref:Glycosyl transferase family protein n=1 Tax=Lacibacterium aquatile TaxID=1168082 RepID=A0ABW5DSB3_9PROT
MSDDENAPGLTQLPHDRHSFAPVVRAIGRGPGRGRSLTESEADQAMTAILREEATPEQVGAFLMLLRYRGETADELAGFVRAVRRESALPWPVTVDFDWPSYADGPSRGAPWFALSAKLVSRAGISVLLHGSLEGPGRTAIRPTLDGIGIPVAASAAEVGSLTWVETKVLSPGLARLLSLRGFLGLRSPANTIARLLDPAGATAGMDGVFHPPYIALHRDAAEKLGRTGVGVLKGGGGEAERAPAKACRLVTAQGETDWPAIISTAGAKPATQDAVGLWHGSVSDPVAEAIVIGTAALALFLAGKADAPAEAEALARELWASRR